MKYLTLKSVTNLAIKSCKPSIIYQRKLNALSSEIINNLKKNSSDFPVTNISLAGSIAKGTWLPNHADVDIFIKLDKNSTRQQLEKSLEIGKITLQKYKWYLRYSEHPYIEALIPFENSEIKVNIVSCFDVSPSNWKSAADRSTYHTEYILENFTPKMKDEVRLLKKFLISNNLYGAEIKVQGFSGYVCELLVLKYKTFNNILKNICNFTYGSSIYFNENDSKFVNLHGTSIIILDPVDPQRNLGSAISNESLNKFIFISTQFLNNPSLDFFKSPKLIINKNLADNLLLIYFKHDTKPVDILWGQLRRSINHLSKFIINNDFSIFRSTISSNDKNQSGFIFLIDQMNISKIKIHSGPMINMIDESMNFVKKNQRKNLLFWLNESGHINSIQNRNYFDLKNLLSSTDSQSSLGLAPGLKKDFYNNFRLYSGKSVISFSSKKPWLYDSVCDLIGFESHLY